MTDPFQHREQALENRFFYAEDQKLIDKIRAKEQAELYEEIGFEVMTRPLEDSSYADECTGCIGPSSVIIYTRRPD